MGTGEAEDLAGARVRPHEPGAHMERDAVSLASLHLDALCRTARAVFAVPVAAIALRGHDRGSLSLDPGLDPVDWAFATRLDDRPDFGRPPVWIADATAEADLAGMPVVSGTPGVRLLASVPFGPEDLGRLAIFDTTARPLPADGIRRLEDLGAIADQWVRLALEAREARDREAEFRLLAETTTDTLVRGDLEGVRLYVSPSVTELLGYAPSELVGVRAIEIVHPEDVPAFRGMMGRVRTGELKVGLCEMRQRHRDGTWVWMEAAVRLTHDRETGQPNGYVASARGIGRRKALEAKLERLASHDALTGLPNRMLFEQHLRTALSETASTGRHFSVLYMDLDHFKRVNDSLGHQTGDLVLVEAARRFRAVLRMEDVVARIGGDEFVALVAVGRSGAATLAGRLIAALARPIAHESGMVGIGLSVGISSAPDDGQTVERLLAVADQALYSAKAAGRGVFRFHETSAGSR